MPSNAQPSNNGKPRPRTQHDIVAYLRNQWGAPNYNRSLFKQLLDSELEREQTVRTRPKKPNK